MELDIYDFDKTIVPFDSGSLFVFYCMVHYPWCVLYLPVIAISGILLLVKAIGFTSFKKSCFGFIPMIPLEKAVKKFWDKHEKSAFKWFTEGKKRYRVIISASPNFLLEEIAKRLSFDKLICTVHNKKSGMIIGENCRGDEKVRRFYEEFDKDNVKVMDVYSDSYTHDRPIFSLSTNKCFHIENGEKVEFNYNDIYKR